MKVNEINESTLLFFSSDFDERTAWEVEQKGWFEGAMVIMPDGLRIPLSFWDPTRLSQAFNDVIKAGGSCFAEPGLIIVPSVTREFMQAAVKELAQAKYFDRLIALTKKY